MSMLDNQGAIAWYEVFLKVVPIIDAVKKRLKQEFVFIPLWHGTNLKYVYHLDKPARDAMYSYLEDEQILKKIGFIFGNDKIINKWKRLFDIGIYAFLPIYEINKKWGDEYYKGEKIRSLCSQLAKSLKGRTDSDFKKVSDLSKKLLDFLFFEFKYESFTDLLVPKNSSFASAYDEIFKIASKSGNFESQQLIISRFLRANFRGIYTSSKSFQKLAISAKPSEIKEQAEEIASRISKGAYRKVQNKGILHVFENLIAIFEPNARREAVAKELGSIPSASFILTDEVHFKRIKRLFDAFDCELSSFDEESEILHPRAPVIVNIYRDENSHSLRSVMAGLNPDADSIQQIKFGISRIGNPKKRCLSTATRYSIFRD